MGAAGQALASDGGRRPPADGTEGGHPGAGRGRHWRAWGCRRPGGWAPQLLNGLPVVPNKVWSPRISACILPFISLFVPHLKKKGEESGATVKTLNICTGEVVQNSTKRKSLRSRCLVSSQKRSQEWCNAVLGSTFRTALVPEDPERQSSPSVVLRFPDRRKTRRSRRSLKIQISPLRSGLRKRLWNGRSVPLQFVSWRSLMMKFPMDGI